MDDGVHVHMAVGGGCVAGGPLAQHRLFQAVMTGWEGAPFHAQRLSMRGVEENFGSKMAWKFFCIYHWQGGNPPPKLEATPQLNIHDCLVIKAWSLSPCPGHKHGKDLEVHSPQSPLFVILTTQAQKITKSTGKNSGGQTRTHSPTLNPNVGRHFGQFWPNVYLGTQTPPRVEHSFENSLV